ncbi:MAG: hypothetical protein WCZ72_11575 [Gemmobacter sp.]
MNMIRPEVAALLIRGREVIAAGTVAALGFWALWRGSWPLAALGGVALAAGLFLAILALRRLRFRAGPGGPGVIEIDEGQVGWFGPGIGGFVSLAELAEIGLVTIAGLRCWRLRQSDGRLLLIPVEAEGAERLFDAFAVLPGLTGARLLAALDSPGDTPVVWRRDLPPALT